MFTSVLSTALVATTVVAERSSLELDTLSHPEMAPRRRADYFGRYPLERAAFELGERSVLTRLAREIESIRRARTVATTPNGDGERVCIYMPDPADDSWSKVVSDAVKGMIFGEEIPKYYACKTTAAVSFCSSEAIGLDDKGNRVGAGKGKLKLMGNTCAVLSQEPDDCRAILHPDPEQIPDVTYVEMKPYEPPPPAQLAKGTGTMSVRDFLALAEGEADEDGDKRPAWADLGAGAAGAAATASEYRMPSDWEIMKSTLEGGRNHRCDERQIQSRHPDYEAYMKAGLEVPFEY